MGIWSFCFIFLCFGSVLKAEQVPSCSMVCNGAEKDITCNLLQDVARQKLMFSLCGDNNEPIVNASYKDKVRYYVKPMYHLKEEVVKNVLSLRTNDTSFDQNPNYTLNIGNQAYTGQLTCENRSNMKGECNLQLQPNYVIVLLCMLVVFVI